MRRHLHTLVLLLVTTVLTSCMYSRTPYLNNNLSKETWQSNIDTDSSKWLKGATQWFLTGDAIPAEVQKPPYSMMGTMHVDVPEFSRIAFNGQYKVELFSSPDKQTVYVRGFTKDIDDVDISVRGKTLHLKQRSGARREIKHVIVRIGVKHIDQLEQMGSGSIEAVQVFSPRLKIISRGGGPIFFRGGANIHEIVSLSSGNVTVLGAITPQLDIKSMSTGNVNISGNVGVHKIDHRGTGDINIIGANTDNLHIDATGVGKIGIDGVANVRQIKTSGRICVYLNHVATDELYAYASDKSLIGMAGDVNNLYLYATNASMIYAQSLLAHNAYARASYSAHINVTAGNKMYASATKNASVYFYGQPEVLSQFVSGNGVVIPVYRYSSNPYDYNNLRRNEQKVKFKDETVVRKGRSAFKYRWVNGKLVRVKK